MLRSEASARLADPSYVGRTKPRGDDKPGLCHAEEQSIFSVSRSLLRREDKAKRG